MSTDGKGRTRDALTTGIQDQIVDLIKGWKPDWEDFSASALERKVTCCLGINCTRQGLLKKDAIRAAFNERIALKTKKPAKQKSADVVVLQQRITRLENQLAERGREVVALQEMVVRYRHNAKYLGLPAERLEAPIAPRVTPVEAKA
jgi:hypothetical protein